MLGNRSELTGNTRDKLLSTVQNSDLSKIVKELYRPGATVVMAERVKQLKSLSTSGKLGLKDLDVVDALINDLEYAISLFK